MKIKFIYLSKNKYKNKNTYIRVHYYYIRIIFKYFLVILLDMNEKTLIKRIQDSKVIIFDIDNTLYLDDFEYIKGKGTVRERYDFFTQRTYDLLSKRLSPEKVEEKIIREYKNLEDKITFSFDIDGSVLDSLHRDKKTYASTGTLISEKFGTDNMFLHKLFSHINFENILTPNDELQSTIKRLKKEGKKLGIYTNNMYETSCRILKTLGLNVNSFEMPIKGKYKFLVRENTIKAKPSPDTYKLFSEIYGVDKDLIVYVGDSIRKDVIPSASVGINSIYLNPQSEIKRPKTVNNQEGVQFLEIKTIRQLYHIFFEKESERLINDYSQVIKARGMKNEKWQI